MDIDTKVLVENAWDWPDWARDKLLRMMRSKYECASGYGAEFSKADGVAFLVLNRSSRSKRRAICTIKNARLTMLTAAC